MVGHLPDPRSGASAVTIGHQAYLLGGDDGSRADAEILSTSDGKHFKTLASLPVPVGDAAAAAVDGKVYVFGGEADGGKNRGRPVDDVQMFDPATNTATVVGHLPDPTVGAVAAVLAGHVYVAGGSSVVVGAAGTATSSVGATASSTTASSATSNKILAFDTTTGKALAAGTLPAPVAYPGVEVVGTRAWLVGGESSGSAVSSVEMFTPNVKFGTAGATGAGSPFYGDRLLVADRGNNRLLLLNDQDQIVWTYPSAYAAAPPGGFYFPDDAFFAKHGTEIISNQEGNETIVIIGFPSGQLLWQYGHPLQPGTAPGIPARTRRRLPAQERPGHRRRCPGVPSAGHQPRQDGRDADRHRQRLRARPAQLHRLTKRRYPAGRRGPAGLRDHGLLGERVDDDRASGVDGAAADPLPLGPPADRTRSLPDLRLLPAGRDLGIQPGRTDPLPLRPRLGAKGSSTSHRSPSCCRAVCS